MKNLLNFLFLISFQTFGQLFEGQTYHVQGGSIITNTPGLVFLDKNQSRLGLGSTPGKKLHISANLKQDSTNYELDIAGSGKIRDNLMILQDLKMPILNDGKVFYGGNNSGKTNPLFYYDDSTQTLYVPNIIATGEYRKRGWLTFWRVRQNETVYPNDWDYVFMSPDEKDVTINLSNESDNGMMHAITIKKDGGKYRAFVVVNGEKIKLKNEPLKLLFDGYKWHKNL